jgi:NAD(P)-dependent dehydrogenase (short-subunit alcohol dehydrogenase family)
MNIKLKPLDQQVVVVFGASSGMGRATAIKFAQRGAKVVVAARGEAGLQSLVNEIQNAGGQAVYRVADAAKFDQVQAIADFAIQEYGRLDTWVGCAGVWVTSRFEDTKPEEFRQILEVNLMGQAHGAWAALPYLRQNLANGESSGGAFIAFSSVLGQIGLPLTSAYCASKHGINGFLDSLRIELMQENVPISITNIMPFGTNTPIYSTGLTRLGYIPRPAPPIIQPEVVADAAIFAAEHPIRQIYGSGYGKTFALANQIMPEVMDTIFTELSTAKNQSTSIQQSEDVPNGLYNSVANYQTHGIFDDESIDYSPYVAFQMNPEVKDGLSEVSLALAAVLSSPAFAQSQYSAEILQSLIEDLITQQVRCRTNK